MALSDEEWAVKNNYTKIYHFLRFTYIFCKYFGGKNAEPHSFCHIPSMSFGSPAFHFILYVSTIQLKFSATKLQ